MLRREDFWDGLDGDVDGEQVRVTVELSDFDKDISAKAVLADSIVSKAPLTARLTYVFRAAKPLPGAAAAKAGKSNYEFVVFGGTDETTRIGSDVRRHLCLRVLPVLRDPETDLQSWSKTPLRPLLERLDLPEDELATIAGEIGKAAAKLVDGAGVKGLNDIIITRLEEMVGKLFSLETKLGVAATMPEQLLRSIRLLTAGVNERPISEVSLGTASLVYLVLLLEHLKQQQDAGEVVTTFLAVEEREAHLHPSLQRLVFRHLLRLNTPLLLTSHSTHIASVSPLLSLVTLRPSAADGTLAYSAAGAKLSKQQIKDIERYLDVNRAEMLVARGVILVEGSAELFLIPMFATAIGVDLESFGVIVSSVHGTDFAPYRKLLSKNGLSIPRVIITDGDPDPDDDVVPAGVKRGQKMLSGPDDALDKAIAGKDYDEARRRLRALNCFVGDVTLEVDFLSVAADEFKKTFKELVSSKLKRSRFDALVTAAAAGDAKDAAKMLARIESVVGKGRFAQRLAAHIGAIDPPSYIKKAIERIVKLVKDDADAK